MFIVYNFDTPLKFEVKKEDIKDFLWDMYSEDEPFQRIIKETGLDKELGEGTLETEEAIQILCANITKLLANEEFVKLMKEYFRDEAWEQCGDDGCTLTESFEEEETEEVEEEEDDKVKKDYFEKYGDTIVFADGEIEVPILGVKKTGEHQWNIKIENPLYVADISDEHQYIWIASPENEQEEEIDLLPHDDTIYSDDDTETERTEVYSSEAIA